MSDIESSATEEDRPLPHPDVFAAGQRLLCLMSCGARAYFEGELAVDPSHREDIADLVQWLEHEGLMAAMSQRERERMLAPPGAWEPGDCTQYAWAVEAAGCIAWALQLLSAMIPYDDQFSPGDIMDTHPQTGGPVEPWLAQLALRDEAVVKEAREEAELWLWRSRAHAAFHDQDKPLAEPDKRIRLAIIRNAALRGERDGYYEAVDGDLPAFGKRYADLTVDEWHEASSIAQGRLHALNWLCGYARDWDAVPLDT